MATKNKVAEKSVNAPVTAIAPGPQQTGAIIPAPAPASSLAANAPPQWLVDQMRGQAPRGLEKVDKNDLTYPRLVLVQGLTPGVSTGECHVGDMIDNLSKEVLCARGAKLEFIPVIYNKSRMRFGAEMGDPIECRSRDSLKAQKPNGQDQGGVATNDCTKCVLKDWDDSAEDGAPTCTEFHNIVCLLPQHGNRAIVVSFKSSASKVAKRFLSACSQVAADFFAQKFELWAVNESSSDGKFDYQNFEFGKVGWASQDEYKAGERTYKQLHSKEWEADVSDLEAEETPEPGSDMEEAEVVTEASPASAQTVDAVPVPPATPKKPADRPF